LRCYGTKLASRELGRQQVEVLVKSQMLDRMTALGMPRSERVPVNGSARRSGWRTPLPQVRIVEQRYAAVNSCVFSVYDFILLDSVEPSMKAKVAERGQVTIPKALRKKLGLAPGTILDFEADNGRLVAVKVQPRGPIDAVFGTLGQGRSTDDLMSDLRDPV